MQDPSGRHPFAKRSLGQNFLTDPNYIRKIIDAVRPTAGDAVLEIGPGRGALTERLLDSGAYVFGIELDRALARQLNDRFATKRFHVIEADVLDFDFHTLREMLPAESPLSKPKLVANLPYYISTAILQRLAQSRTVFAEFVLMFQKEVVDRITASPADPDRGFLTVICEAAFAIERLFDVPPTAFAPRPKVWSSVVKLLPKAESNLDSDGFVSLLSAAFRQKRKTIQNNLKNVCPDPLQFLHSAEIDPKRRAESLTLHEWSALYEAWVRNRT